MNILFQLFTELYTIRYKIIILTLVFGCAGFVFVSSLESKYATTMIVGSADETLGGTKKIAQSQISFAPSLLGGVEARGDFAKYLTLFSSHENAIQLLEDDEIIAFMFPKLEKDRLAWLPGFIRNNVTTPILDTVLGPKDRNVNSWDIYNWLQTNISKRNALTTPEWTISISSAQPEMAEKLLTKLHGNSDFIIQMRIKDMIEKRILYLKNRLSNSNIAEERQEIVSLLHEQEGINMLLGTGAPFAAEVLVNTFSTTRPSWPPKLLFLFLFSILGIVVGTYPLWLKYLFIRTND